MSKKWFPYCREFSAQVLMNQSFHWQHISYPSLKQRGWWGFPLPHYKSPGCSNGCCTDTGRSSEANHDLCLTCRHMTLVWVNNEASQISKRSWPWGFSLHYSWVLRLDPGNKLSEALCQYETLAATMGSASNYTVDRHHHKGAERGPPPFSHTLKNESVCCRSELCLYSICSFCPRPLFSHQWGLKCWWKPGGTDFSLPVRVHVHLMGSAPAGRYLRVQKTPGWQNNT